MRVFFDASVIIAALLSSTGGSAQLFKYISLKKIIGITSQTALEEVFSKSVKINKSKEELEKFITGSGLIVRYSVTMDEIEPYQNKIDISDAHLVAAAILTKCTFLATLDKKHLLRLDIQKQFLPLRIVSPKDLLEEIINKGF